MGNVAQKLPVGMTEFDVYWQKLVDVYGVPNLPSYKNAVASMIMHLPPNQFKAKPKFFFIGIRKAMANQVAYEVIQQIREQEKKAVGSAEDAPSNEQPKQGV